MPWCDTLLIISIHAQLSFSSLFQHHFLSCEDPLTIIMDLIANTKDAVCELDNLQYSKMKKILFQDGNNGPATEDAKEDEVGPDLVMLS